MVVVLGSYPRIKCGAGFAGVGARGPLNAFDNLTIRESTASLVVDLSRKWRGRAQPPCYTTRAMEHIEVSIRTDGAFRATEVIADLRNVAETLFNPMRLVGFWDQQAGGMHLCPQEQLGRECLHNLPPDDPRRVDYATTAGGEMRASLEIGFPHAGVFLYLR